MTNPDYRARIYDRYVEARTTATGALASAAEAAPDAPRSRDPYLVRLVRQHFPRDLGARVLDLGCGDGALLDVARGLGYTHVSGVDRSAQQVAAAARRGIDVREGDLVESLRALAPESLDAVVAFDVIEHFRRDELLALVDDVARVLRPGGRFIVHAPNGESPFVGRIRYGDFTHEQAFTRLSMHQLLWTAGFREVRCHEDTPVVHGVTSAARRVLWSAIRTALRVYIAAETGDTSGAAIFSQNLLAVATK